MKVEVKKKVCSTCPWREENAWQLQIETIENMLDNDIISPCHQELNKVVGSCTEGVEKYAAAMKANDTSFVVCKGYIQGRLMGKTPFKNPMFHELYMSVIDNAIEEDMVDTNYIKTRT